MVAHYVKNSQSENPANFLKNRLSEGAPLKTDIDGVDCSIIHEEGDADWYKDIPVHSDTGIQTDDAAELLPDFALKKSARRQLERMEPSSAHESITPAAHLFGVENRKILDFGNAIHAMFEAVEWIEDADAGAIAAQWVKTAVCSDDVKRDATAQFIAAMQSEDTRKALSKPDGRVMLWREKSFELVLDGRWITGQFDRVTIRLNENGKPVAADILDYKSNRIDKPDEFKKAIEHYRPQLEAYTGSLSAILKIPRKAITASLLFTRASKLFQV
jgi:hypothetical protein